MSKSITVALILAVLAAVGNALFAYGQIRATESANLFLYITYALVFCALLFVIAMIFLPRSTPVEYLLENRWWIVVGGAGYFLTFTGFYFLCLFRFRAVKAGRPVLTVAVNVIGTLAILAGGASP